jgi:hypothetical protein
VKNVSIAGFVWISALKMYFWGPGKRVFPESNMVKSVGIAVLV